MKTFKKLMSELSEGKDLGKPGKNFDKIAAKAAKRYGSKEAGNRVAGAILKKIRANEETIDEVVRSDSKRFNDHDYHNKLVKHVRDSGVQISYQDKHRPGQVAVGPRNWRKSNVTDMEWALRNKQDKVTLWREEIEELDELKASTLGSYIKKASHDVATRSAAVARYAEREHEATKKGDYKDARLNRKISDKQFDKSWNRRKGIAAATDKLTKEETEHLDKDIRHIDEVLQKSDPVEKWIHDFVHSDNPKFAGKSKEERIKMALGAYYGNK